MKKKAKSTPKNSQKAGKVGYKNPPKNRQFGKEEGNPRAEGRWKKEDSISYQYNKILRMTEAEFAEFKARGDLTLAQKIAIRRVLDAVDADGGMLGLKATEVLTDRTEGKAKQSIEIETKEQQDDSQIKDEELAAAIFG